MNSDTVLKIFVSWDYPGIQKISRIDCSNRKELGFQRQTMKFHQYFCLKPLESLEEIEWMMDVLSVEDGNKLMENFGNIIICVLRFISFGE